MRRGRRARGAGRCKDCGRASVGNTLATRGRGTGAWLAAPPHALLLCKELTLEIPVATPEALLNLIEIPAAPLLCKELLLNLVVLGLEGAGPPDRRMANGSGYNKYVFQINHP